MKSNQVYYLHLREHEPKLDSDGFISEDNSLIVSPKGGCTVAFEYVPETNTLLYALAFCSIKDSFNKHLGRAKAGGRLNSVKHAKTKQVDPNVTVSNIIELLKEEVYKYKEEKGDCDARLYMY